MQLTKREQAIYSWLTQYKGYLKKSFLNAFDACKIAKPSEQRIFKKMFDKARVDYKGFYRASAKAAPVVRFKKASTPVAKKAKTLSQSKVSPVTKYDPKNTLVIGDTHIPFEIEGYLEFCLETQKKYNCGSVVHIGDLIDNHATSYHESDPDGLSAGSEYELALSKCRKWYEAFPNVKICIGNHDRIPFRKAYTAGLPKNWLKTYQEMFESPKTWDWGFVHKVNGVIYQHGTGMSGEMASINAARENRQSTVIGHLHTVCNNRFLASEKDLIFGMSIGCGIDHTKYAFAYGRENTRKPVISCGVVLNGQLPINIPMNI